MTRRRTLPLGVDLGTSRTRVALVERDASGAAALVAVAGRATAGDPARALAAALAELRTRERRCVLAVGAPDAVLRAVTFPPMRRSERLRAARFEAARFVPSALDDAAVRVVTAGGDRCVVGIARRAALEAAVAAANTAALRAVAVDDTAFALLRALPAADAVVDIGERSTVLTVRDGLVPAVRVVAPGGGAMTDALAASLGIDASAADDRKRSIGLGGAAQHACAAVIDALASALATHRAASAGDIRSIALTGNGARLAGLAAALERAVAIPVHLGALPAGVTASYPPDVVRVAAPDWALAVGLALWELAA